MTTRPPETNYTIRACLSRFQIYMKTATGLGEQTQWRYGYEVERFARGLGNRSINDLMPQHLLSWNAGFWEAGAAPATVQQKRSALKKFLKYLDRFERITRAKELLEAFDEMRVPRSQSPQGQQRPLREPYSLSRDRIGKMYTAALSYPGVGVRNGAMVTFLWATGVRRAELANLPMEKLDLVERQATVVGKGQKERVVYFDQDTAEELVRWLADRASWPIRDDTVFLSADGCRLTPNTVSAIIRECARKAGLRKEVWTHLFRHTRATQLLEDGMPLVEVSEFLGHGDVNTTRKYYHQDSGRLRDAHDQAMQRRGSPDRRRAGAARRRP